MFVIHLSRINFAYHFVFGPTKLVKSSFLVFYLPHLNSFFVAIYTEFSSLIAFFCIVFQISNEETYSALVYISDGTVSDFVILITHLCEIIMF